MTTSGLPELGGSLRRAIRLKSTVLWRSQPFRREQSASSVHQLAATYFPHVSNFRGTPSDPCFDDLPQDQGHRLVVLHVDHGIGINENEGETRIVRTASRPSSAAPEDGAAGPQPLAWRPRSNPGAVPVPRGRTCRRF